MTVISQKDLNLPLRAFISTTEPALTVKSLLTPVNRELKQATFLSHGRTPEVHFRMSFVAQKRRLLKVSNALRACTIPHVHLLD